MSDAENSSGKEEEKEEEKTVVKKTNDVSNNKESPKKSNEAKESPKKSNEVKESPKKSNVSKKPPPPKKEETTEEEEEDDDDEEDGKDGKKPLFDQPLEVTGSRERKKVQRLEVSQAPAKDKKLEIAEGSGDKLGDCARIEHNIGKIKSEDLKTLHRILFNRAGSSNEIKKNIRVFCGFAFSKSSPEFDKKKGTIAKLFIPDLKKMCEVLDLERSGTKEAIVERVLSFLMKPKDSGKKPPKSKSRSSRGSKGKSNDKSKGKKKKSKSDSGDSEEEEEDGEDNGEEDDDDEKDGEDSEKDDEKDDSEEQNDSDSDASDKKKAKEPPSKPAPKAKKEPAKKAPAKRTKKASSGEDSDSSDDDEPLKKKAKSPPTNDEIMTFIKKILEGANLEEITMKTVCKQVYAAYPDFDLADRKTFIKETVRSLI